MCPYCEDRPATRCDMCGRGVPEPPEPPPDLRLWRDMLTRDYSHDEA